MSLNEFDRSERECACLVACLVRRFRPSGLIAPFTRCLRCDGQPAPIAKDTVLARNPPKVCARYDEFEQCQSCGHVYRKGAHFQHMLRMVEQLVPSQRDTEGT